MLQMTAAAPSVLDLDRIIEVLEATPSPYSPVTIR
jgi:hypothetical protein